MTREQAKTEIMQIYGSLSEEKKKALDVAFKAMEQSDRNEFYNWDAPIRHKADGEYIPKQTVLENIDQWYEDKADIEDLIVKITYIQGVAIPNKVGHWEYNQYDGNPNIGNWHCSECRNIVSDMPTCMGKPLYEFCPHCGSPMEIER